MKPLMNSHLSMRIHEYLFESKRQVFEVQEEAVLDEKG
jgi:hypothetical protein